MTAPDHVDILVDLARDAQSRYYGKYRGSVVDNDDPNQLGRLKVLVPSVLGSESTDWALPCTPFGGSTNSGWFAMPEIGAQIWVEFEMGDIDHPIWVGTYWVDRPEEAGDDDLGAWQTRIMRTAGGQLLRFDDAEDASGITIRHKTGAIVQITDNGSITIDDGAGEVITLDIDGRVIIEDQHGNSIKLADSGINAKDKSGNEIEMVASGVTVKADSVTVEATSVDLGGSNGEPVLKGTAFLTAFMAHIHPAAPGPTGPPTPGAEQSALSMKVKTL